MKFKKYLKKTIKQSKKHKPKPRKNTGRWMPGMNPGYSAMILPEAITFQDEVVGTQSGQKDLRLTAYKGNTKVGWLDYTDFHGEISIKIVKVKEQYRRQGIGKGLILKLQKQYPKKEIGLGMTTGEGAKLIKSLLYMLIKQE